VDYRRDRVFVFCAAAWVTRLQRMPLMERKYTPRWTSEKTLHFKPNKEKIDEIKIDICRKIDLIMVMQQWNQRQLAFYLGTSRANVNRVVNRRIEHLTLSQLFSYLSKLRPEFKFLISIT
jgi:predicted XRE-type DNA-binding protein